MLGAARVNDRIVTAARDVSGVDVVALASRSSQRAAAEAQRLGIQRSCGSYDELLQDDQVDAVYIGLPNALHLPWAEEAVRAGKHVLVEKPLSRFPARVAAAFDLAKSLKLALFEGLMFRLHSQTRQVRSLVASGTIGRVRLIQCHFSYSLERVDDARWRQDLDGGALMDLGCYCVAASRLLAGESSTFQAIATFDSGVDTRVSATMGTTGEVITRFDVDLALPRDQHLVIYGENGKVVVPSPFHCRELGFSLEIDGKHEHFPVAPENPFTVQLRAFADAAADPSVQEFDASDAIAQADALDKLSLIIHRSAPLPS